MGFLPTDYEAPKATGAYLKLQNGENRIRILSDPILGWEDWKDNKPIRFRMENKPEGSLDPKKPIRHFWAMIVWNYKEKAINIFEITQATIRKRIEELSKDSDWGDPFHYDLKIIKSGEGMTTEYIVNPVAHKELDQFVKEIFHDTPVNLEVMFNGGDPFKEASTVNRTKGFWQMKVKEEEVEHSTELTIPTGMADGFMQIINAQIKPYDGEYLARLLQFFGKTSIDKIPLSKQSAIAKNINAKIEEIAKLKAMEEVPF